MSEWRPISEAPRDGTSILVAVQIIDWIQWVARWSDVTTGPAQAMGFTWRAVCCGRYAPPTHWMPLPPPPETGQ